MRLALVLLFATITVSRGVMYAKRDFGAKGDGMADDTAALQRAIDTVQNKSQQLYIDAGLYIVNSPLVVALAGHESGRPVAIRGEGRTLTTIKANQSMTAVLFFNSTAPTHSQLAVTTTKHSISDISIDASGLADSAVSAPAITRSSFRQMGFAAGRFFGLSFGYGWINRIESSRFVGNGAVAVNAVNNINNVVIANSQFESNPGIGILIDDGYAVQITGNVFESLGGPALYARALHGLTYSSNYHEANNMGKQSLIRFANQTTGETMGICIDIILNGASASVRDLSRNGTIPIGSEPSGFCTAAVLSANYFNPNNDKCGNLYASLHSFGADGVVLEANHCAGCTETGPEEPRVCIPAIDTPRNGTKDVSRFRVALNTGFTAQVRNSH